MEYSQKKELISIVVPVYNVENYLARCVESILKQSYKDLEIILVDDGSTDNCGTLCDSYAAIDFRVKVIHKNNGGLSDARNAGIDSSSGRYIMFVDSDDWITPSCVETLYNLLISNTSDIAVGAFRRVKNDNGYDKQVQNRQKCMDNTSAVKELLYQNISTSAWAKLYKRTVFEELRYPVGKLFEDVEVTYMAFKAAERVVYTSEIVYNYFYRSESIVCNQFSLRKMDYYYNATSLLEQVKKDYPELINAAISRRLWASIHLIVKMGKERKKFPKENYLLWADIKKYRIRVLKDKNCRMINKLVIILTYFGQNILCFVYEARSKEK